MKFKKLTMTLGSITAIAAPIAAVVSCGAPSSSQYSEEDLLKMSNLKSSEAHSKLQDLWLSKVLINEYGIKNKTPLEVLKKFENTGSTSTATSEFETEFKSTLSWVLKNKLFASKDALSSIYQSLKTNAPDEVLNTAAGAEKTVVTNLNVKVFDRNNIKKAVDDVLTGNDWKDIFYNNTDITDGDVFNPSILGIKDLILKMMVTKKYLSLSANDIKTSLPSEYAKEDSKFRDAGLIDPTKKNFPLVVSAMSSRLAYKTSISLDESKSKEFVVSNGDNVLNTTEQGVVFQYIPASTPTDKGTGSKFLDKFTHTIKSQTSVDEILAKVPAYRAKVKEDQTVGFIGLGSLPSGDDNLNTSTVSAIKLAKGANSRDGFVVTEKDGTKLVNDKVRFSDLDKTKVELNYYTSLMPVYSEKDKSLEFLTAVDATDPSKDIAYTDDKLSILMDEAYTKDSSLYSMAIKYFTQKENPVKLKIENDWARNYYIDEGLTYIDDEK